MSLSYSQMEEHISGARVALDAARNPEMAAVLSSLASAHALVVIAECMYRNTRRKEL